MVVEFLGIAVFSYLMGSINSIISSESTIQLVIDTRIEDIEGWLRKIEKSRNKNFSKQLYDAIKDYTEKSYYYDYSNIQESEFFMQLKPKIRHKFISGLFGQFLTNFFYLFNDDDFEGGCEFTSDFLSNINSKLWLPGNEIVGYGGEFEDLVMIQESVVSLFLRVDKPEMYKNLP